MTTPFAKHYAQLNDEQRQAVDQTDGPMLILAGPGTGKTQLLSVRAANIILNKNISPENILILTFTNAATRAMRDRLASIIGRDGYDVEVETFHGFANSIVLESENAIKFVKEKVEISEVEKIRAIEYILDNVKGVRDLRPFGAPYIHRSEIEKHISALKNEGVSPEEFKKLVETVKPDNISVEDKHIPRLKALSLVYEKYEKMKDDERHVLFDDRGRIDFDDMILVAIQALKNDKDLRNAFRDQYKYIMVDEYQDTNGAQLDLLFGILDVDKNNLCCVGDDDQSIYRFQGATLSNFRVLKEKFNDLKTIALKKNYRSTKEITEISKQIIKQLPSGERIEDKILQAQKENKNKNVNLLEFSTEEEELAYIAEEVRRHVEMIKKDKTLSDDERAKPFNNIAVLVRKRSQILKIIDIFLKAGIPYATDGKEDIRGEKRVRQMLDVLELASCGFDATEVGSLALYNILTADYVEAEHSDVLKFVEFVNKGHGEGKGKKTRKSGSLGLVQSFMEHFCVFKKDKFGNMLRPTKDQSEELEIHSKLKFRNPFALHDAAWGIDKLLRDANNFPVHDLLMTYIDDMYIYKFVLKRYKSDRVLRIRELRALVSFIKVIKDADLVNPALCLKAFNDELNLRESHNIAITGRLATLSQDGVRIYTSHSSKGLEFYSVFMPFALTQKKLARSQERGCSFVAHRYL